ncbi:hypothetical protein ACIQB5_08245 [Streptomyces sp. NPDC088560]|uniref:hypothetical protein n=1 Tax=Streptomyces sp. NPDC088560 TaxID=3365868 RepID=UPI00381FCAC1
MTEALQDALSARARCSRFELPDVEHRLGLWFREHPAHWRAFVERLPAAPA